MITDESVKEAIELLNLHHDAFWRAAPHASKTGHPVPSDTRGWSQIIVSALTGLRGMDRRKGPDLIDGSDVKAANTWKAIDTPRFNGVLKAGTKSKHSGKITFLDGTPYIFFPLWDINQECIHRFRIWVVRPKDDPLFFEMASKWYAAVERGINLKAEGKKTKPPESVGSTNFQLQPPRGKDHNVFGSDFLRLEYPLLFEAHATHPASGNYEQKLRKTSLLRNGLCKEAQKCVK